MKGREDIYTLRPLATLISSLRAVGISVYEPTDDDYIAISREQRVREVRFWNTNGMWHIGHDQRFTGPIATLSTPDHDVALRWLICCTGNLYRKKQNDSTSSLSEPLPDSRTAGKFPNPATDRRVTDYCRIVRAYSSITTPDSKLRQLTRSKFCMTVPALPNSRTPSPRTTGLRLRMRRSISGSSSLQDFHHRRDRSQAPLAASAHAQSRARQR